jgi:hypothetical protein
LNGIENKVRVAIFTLYFKVLFMKEERYAQDIKEIREIMDRSSRFSSLSGFSGVLIGIVAIFGAYYLNQTLFAHHYFLSYERSQLTDSEMTHLLLVAVTVIIVSAILGIVFTNREAKRNNEKPWSFQSRRVISNLMIPLVTGGIVCLILLQNGLIGLLLPLSLIFYGLALVNVSKYTISGIRILGMTELVLGVLALYFIEYGLIFWSLGFGVCHIINGIYMQLKR